MPASTPQPCEIVPLEAERGVLGSILLDAGRVLSCCSAAGLGPAHFSIPAHSAIFSTCRDLRAAAAPVDLLTVTEHLRAAGRLDSIGGPAALESLVDATPTAAHAEYYIDLLLEHASRRAIARWIADTATADPSTSHSASPERSPLDQLAAIESSLSDLRAAVEKNHAADLAGANLVQIAETPAPATDILLGSEAHPYLRRGGSLVIVAPSGAGKSTLGVQQDILWSLGRECCGIPAMRPLRTLTIQAENDPGDQHRACSGILSALALPAADLATCRAATRSLWITNSTGPAFLRLLERAILQHHPDIVRIDPLLGYIGADPTDVVVLGEFCRVGLNTIAKRHKVGIVVMHHPCKTNRLQLKDVNNWTPFDWQYFGAGGADIANWARAELVLWPEGEGLFRCIAAKRWPGWRLTDGSPQLVRYIRHGRGDEILWREADPETSAAAHDRAQKIAGRKAKGDPKADAVKVAQMLLDADAAVTLTEARRFANQLMPRSRAEAALDLIVEAPAAFGIWVQTTRRDNKTFIGKRESVLQLIGEAGK